MIKTRTRKGIPEFSSQISKRMNTISHGLGFGKGQNMISVQAVVDGVKRKHIFYVHWISGEKQAFIK